MRITIIDELCRKGRELKFVASYKNNYQTLLIKIILSYMENLTY